MGSRAEKKRLGLIQAGFTPKQAKRLDFLRWVIIIKPKKSLANRTASRSGVETWNALPKSAKAEKGGRRRRNKPRSWIQPGPGGKGML